MRQKKVNTTIIMAFIMISMLLATVIVGNAALEITVDPTSGMPDDSIEVTGTDFAASSPIGIGIGVEANNTDSNMAFAGEGVGPYYGKVSWWPIKPGSFILYADTTSGGGILSNYTDNGDGTLSGSFEGAIGDINYTTGEWSRTSTADLTDLVQVYNATYTRYEFNVTTAGGVVTDPSGAFTANITVPLQNIGTTIITAIDEMGNVATSEFEVIPEGFSVGVVVLLSSVAFALSFFLRKRPET